jgi:hypothetical protein
LRNTNFRKERILSHPEELDRLNEEITSHMGHLNKSFIKVLSLYAFGMIMLRHCGQTQIAVFLSGLCECKYGNMKQRLRELTYEAPAKCGSQRRELEVSSCFTPLLSWVLSCMNTSHKQVVLAFDATYLSDRFIILAISVVVCGTAIPVAWHIRKATDKGEWNPIWKQLFGDLSPAIPSGWQVFVLSDSGLYSKPLFNYLAEKKWSVMMRISGGQGLFRPLGRGKWLPLHRLVKRGMTPRTLSGHCFKGNPLRCQLILQWEDQYESPCLIVTNLPTDKIQHNTYTIRYWIECGFKDFKRGLFHWEQTKMTCPKRAERLWLVMSISLFWLTTIGDTALASHHWYSLAQARPDSRILSAPVLGWIELILSLLQQRPIQHGQLQLYPWLPLPDT